MISVLLSVYNGELYLRDCIQSVLNQSFENFEFVIVDDGSTDSTPDILKLFSSIDKRISIYTRNNHGLASSLNYGLKKCKFDWVCRIDADDLMPSNRLDYFIQCDKRENDILFFSNHIEIDNAGMISRYVNISFKEINQLILFPFRSFAHSSVFYRKQVVIDCGGYRNFFRLCEDRDLWLRLRNLGNIVHLPAYLVFIRKHDLQISNKNKGYDQLIDVNCCIVHNILGNELVRQNVICDELYYAWLKGLVQRKINESFYFHYLKNFEILIKKFRDTKFIYSVYALLVTIIFYPVRFFIYSRFLFGLKKEVLFYLKRF